jgi:methionyl-tRNA synthetase
MIGKEILRFHAVFWPAFLMAADLPLPKRIFAHGWLLFEQDKMSKSRGNIVRPRPIAEVCGMDALRYFLLREVVFGQDGSFSYDALVGRYNSDLANGLGNLASRTLSMINQYRKGVLPKSDGDSHIAEAVTQTTEMALDAFERLEFSRGLENIWQMISIVDKYIVDRAPWVLAKSDKTHDQELLDRTLYSAAEVLRILCGLLYPIIPDSISKIWAQLGFEGSAATIRIADLHFGHLPHGQKVGQLAPVFPRIEAKPAIAKMRELEEQERARQDALLGKLPPATPETPKAAAEAPAPPSAAAVPSTDGAISIDDFVKVDMRVGVVKSAAAVKGADKLLHLFVDIGEAEPRSIVAGIALAYKPEQLVGRKVVIVANLQPRKLRGLQSQGMIVAASLGDGSPVLAGFLEEVPVGARLK